MLANAVSSAVERLYAAAPVGEGRAQVSRVAAVSAISRLKVVGQDEADRGAQALEERDRLQQRQALTRGVLAVFESTGLPSDPSSPEAAGDGGGAADPNRPDPQLEEAILRFIHTMFRTLADQAPAVADAAANFTGRSGANDASREALSARIEALARRLGDLPAPAAPVGGAEPVQDTAAGEDDAAAAKNAAEPDPPTADAAPPRIGGGNVSAASLEKAYAEVVQALHGNLGALAQSPTTRAELVSMMQRLALAIHGAPPIDPGLPTRGGLLSARA